MTFERRTCVLKWQVQPACWRAWDMFGLARCQQDKRWLAWSHSKNKHALVYYEHVHVRRQTTLQRSAPRWCKNINNCVTYTCTLRKPLKLSALAFNSLKFGPVPVDDKCTVLWVILAWSKLILCGYCLVPFSVGKSRIVSVCGGDQWSELRRRSTRSYFSNVTQLLFVCQRLQFDMTWQMHVFCWQFEFITRAPRTWSVIEHAVSMHRV